MRAIGIPGQRVSDQIMTRFAAHALGIPETETEQETVKTAAADCDCPAGCKCACNCHGKSAGTHCPQCGGSMAVKGNMERCACGYAQATAGARKTAETPKRASETSVGEYYKKIFPDDYVSELTGKPDSGKAGESVEYGTVPLDKPVGDVGVKASRVSARDILAFGEEQEGVPQAGDCEVKDGKPAPKSEQPNGSANEAGECKNQGGDSANSVGGPGDIPKGEKPNGAAGEAGDVKTPDLGVPKGAKGFISREMVAKFCPECADEMKRAGIKAISASFIAKTIADKAKQAKTADKKR
jgi:hypothetical protein